MQRILVYLSKQLVFKEYKPKQPLLGRWRVEPCAIKTNHKVDWANEDHCGPCGEQPKIQMENKDITTSMGPNKGGL